MYISQFKNADDNKFYYDYALHRYQSLLFSETWNVTFYGVILSNWRHRKGGAFGLNLSAHAKPPDQHRRFLCVKMGKCKTKYKEHRQKSDTQICQN